MKRSSLVLVVVAACARGAVQDASPPASAGSARVEEPSRPAANGPEAAVEFSAARAAPAPDAGGDAADESSRASAGAPPAEFIDEARVLFRVAACAPAGEIPPRFDAAVVARHCDELGRAYDEYRKGWAELAEPFIAALRPKELPPTAVYPFGGGDLVSALATFPDATEITTISLEPAGDVRPVQTLRPERLAPELAAHRGHLERLFAKAHSRTDNLEKESLAELPGEIVFSLAALVVHGGEPVGLRYFRLTPEGAIRYVTAEDIEAQVHHPRALHDLFANAELRFRAAGGTGPIRVLRHVAFNLDDAHMKAEPGLLAYLEARGRVAAMTKAASHLLWNDHFGRIRTYLLEHADWMISDSTGIPPRYAAPAGFLQETYGRFDGPAPFGLYEARDGNDFKKLFATQPARELSFRYGYPDRDGHAHLIVTYRSRGDAAPSDRAAGTAAGAAGAAGASTDGPAGEASAAGAGGGAPLDAGRQGP